ncbi:MAG: FAD:protein FMN transferase [Acidimicrobiia bacterium]|nr:FAD:protein FMN transferase [Acidimicrobiia bacterium]
MGTTVMVRTRREGEIEAVRHLFEDVERICSRFREDSELTRLNQNPAIAVELSSMLQTILEHASNARQRTGGLVDIGVGQLVSDWGYDRTFTEVEDRTEPPSPRRLGKWTLQDGRLHRPPGVAIDLGGIAKGWTCDLAVERGLASVASAGGDVRSAEETTTVEIIDPWSEPAVTVALGVGALATSSVSRRRWRVGGRDVHHLIDPRTSQPSSSPVLSASALAATAVEAEAAAKAILLLGPDGLDWAERQPWVRSAVVVWNDGNVYATTDLEVAA